MLHRTATFRGRWERFWRTRRLLDTIAVVHFIGDRGLVIVRARRCRASLIYVQMRSSGLSLVRRSSLHKDAIISKLLSLSEPQGGIKFRRRSRQLKSATSAYAIASLIDAQGGRHGEPAHGQGFPRPRGSLGGPTGLSRVGPRSFYSPHRPPDRCRAVVILVCGGGRVARTFTGAVDDDAGTQPPAS